MRAAIAQTEQRIEDLTATLPDTEYSPGNEELARQGRLQDWMKLGGPVPSEAWGKPVQGLRAAAVFSTTRPKLEDEVTVWLLVENVGDREIRFGCSDVTQGALRIVELKAGEKAGEVDPAGKAGEDKPPQASE